MSAYAALVSLRQTLVAVFHHQTSYINQTRARLQILLEEVVLLLDFLDNYTSSTYKATQISALETKMRDAAHKAEYLIEYGIMGLMEITLFGPNLIMSYIIKEVLPFWIPSSLVDVLLWTMIFYLRISFIALDDSEELRRVFYDFNMIVKEVNQIKEARARGEEAETTSAHAALISLRQILDDSDHLRLRSLREMVNFLLDFLGNASTTYNNNNSTLPNLDATIRRAVSKAKTALVEFQLPRKFSLHFHLSILTTLLDIPIFHHAISQTLFRACNMANNYITVSSQEVILMALGQLCIEFASYVARGVLAHIAAAAIDYSDASKNQELPHVIDDFSIIARDATKIKDAYGNHPSNLPPDAAASSRQNSGGARKDVVVGLDGDLIKMKERLLQDSSKRELASIVGMGGIGKTTLAKQVFKDPSIVIHFDVRAWVTVSQEYSLRHVLLCLLDSADMLAEEEKREDNDDKLALYLHQYLTSRRYLIVIDDMWDTEIWDFLSRFFPENYNGSRILITSRLPNVASCLDSSSPLHHMQCLNEDNSWYLLREKAFGEEGCPLELESIGREIATSCRGLPLAIVVVGGLLYKDIQTEIWRDVAEKLKKSELKDIKEQCLEILGLSYNHLPHHLKPCFLYMAVLPRDCEIPIWRLINLWVAERFFETSTSETLEEVAEGYLKVLIDRNLISVSKKSCNGTMRTCSMHDLLRDVCVQNAHKENFLHVVDSESYVTGDGDECPRRLSIHPDALQGDARHNSVHARHESVRSVLCIASKSIESPLDFYLGFHYLQVLDVLELHFGKFPHQIIKLVCLRYLALHYDGPLPASISQLQNLETIVHHHSSFRKYPLLPMVIWRMPNLRHLYVKPGCYLYTPLGYWLPCRFPFLQHLQTLVGIRNFKWSKCIIKRIPNMKKLGISYDVPSSVDWSAYQLDSLVDLHRLETLKIIIKYDDLGSAISHDPPKIAFPLKLKKLSLSGCGVPWANVGALPNLEALKLRREACSGSSWETVEEEFPKLMFLLLEEMSFTRWETDAAHFPRLQRLVIRSCGMLEEIPYAIGDIPTLEIIELVDCHLSAVASAKKIQEEQESMGNEVLKFHIEQRTRDVDRMDLGNLEARGAYPGRLRLLRDVVQYDTIMILRVLGLVILVTDYYDDFDLLGGSLGPSNFLFILLCIYVLEVKFLGMSLS